MLMINSQGAASDNFATKLTCKCPYFDLIAT